MLQRVVEEAWDDGAATIEFERVPEGLEITSFAGHTGIGTVLDDSELEKALFHVVDTNAELKQGDRGTIRVSIHGKTQTLGFEWYHSFGETCFRIHLDNKANQPTTDAEPSLDCHGECAGCDSYAPVDDQGLCEECAAKLERDMIRLGDWDYTMAGFVLPEEERETYRAKVIAEFGEKMELIVDPRAAKSQRKKKSKRGKRTRNRRKSR